MENIVKKRIEEKQALYDSFKADLEKEIGKAQSEYNGVLKAYNHSLNQIRHNPNLSKLGKQEESKFQKDKYLEMAKGLAEKHLDSLIGLIDTWESRKDNSQPQETYLIADKLPQLTYVSYMLETLNSADMLKELYDYISMDTNFGDELVNMVYVKAKALSNTDENKAGTQLESLEKVAERKIINKIVAEIESYKNDFSKDFLEFKKRFEDWKVNSDYPANLYMKTDYRNDFAIPNDLAESWEKKQTSSNNPWSKYNK